MSIDRTFLIVTFIATLAGSGSLSGQNPHPYQIQEVSPLSFGLAWAPIPLEMTAYFDVRPAVAMNTDYGTILIQLYPDAAPLTVSNFLGYVDRGAYTDTLFHRSNASLDIIQGGGFKRDTSGVLLQAPIPLEYNLPNEVGTIAMARTTDPDSATSQFYFNAQDNSTNLGQDNGGGYAVFGRIYGDGLNVVRSIRAVPVYSVQGSGTYRELPIDGQQGGTVEWEKVPYVSSVTRVTPNISSADFGYSVVSITPGYEAWFNGSTLWVQATDVAPASGELTIRARSGEGIAEASLGLFSDLGLWLNVFFPGGEDVGNGQYTHPSMGLMADLGFPLMWSENFGYWYVIEAENGFWAYTFREKMEWIWSSVDFYPYFFSTKTGDWLQHFVGVPNWYYDWSTDTSFEAP